MTYNCVANCFLSTLTKPQKTKDSMNFSWIREFRIVPLYYFRCINNHYNRLLWICLNVWIHFWHKTTPFLTKKLDIFFLFFTHSLIIQRNDEYRKQPCYFNKIDLFYYMYFVQFVILTRIYSLNFEIIIASKWQAVRVKGKK